MPLLSNSSMIYFIVLYYMRSFQLGEVKILTVCLRFFIIYFAVFIRLGEFKAGFKSECQNAVFEGWIVCYVLNSRNVCPGKPVPLCLVLWTTHNA